MRLNYVWSILFAMGGGAFLACTAPSSTWLPECDEEAPFPGQRCQEQLADAGADATDADASDPGKTPQATEATCAGRCVPEPNGA